MCCVDRLNQQGKADVRHDIHWIREYREVFDLLTGCGGMSRDIGWQKLIRRENRNPHNGEREQQQNVEGCHRC